MDDMKEVFDALRNCITKPKFFPWEDQEKVRCECVKMPMGLLLDILNVLSEQLKQKHGHWISYGHGQYRCSVCNDGKNMNFVPNYCSTCGARMDEKMVGKEVRQDD